MIVSSLSSLLGPPAPESRPAAARAAAPSAAPASGDVVELSPRALELLDRRSVDPGERETLQAILARAEAVGADADPKAFLRSLTAGEMEVLRKVHTLADPIRIDPLDQEGAANLLRPPGEARDLDDDGLLAVGAGKGWTFPPPNAPEAVKAAWEDATAGFSDLQKALKMGPFLAVQLAANIETDAQGGVARVHSPGEAGYRNAFAGPGFSYKDLVGERLSWLEKTRAYVSVDQYREQRAFLASFRDALERRGAA